MPILILLLSIIIALGATTMLLIGLYLHERSRKKILDDNLTIHSQEIISEAIKKAQTLLSSSELEALKLTTDSKFYRDRLEQKFDGEIQKAVENLKAKFSASQQDYLNYVKYLKEETDKNRTDSLELIRQQVSEMFAKFEVKLTDFLNETQKNSVESIALEIKSTRQLIDTYKQSQLKIIDENIISMLERTLSLVMTKKLTLNDQIDLVYESLEKAKNEKFLI